MFTLEGRTALVVGGSGCVGLEIVKSFLNGGMNVAALCSISQKADAVTQQFSVYGERFGALASKGRQMKEILEEICEKYGGLDVTVTCQGALPEFGNVEKLSLTHWKHIMSSHLLTNLHLFQDAVPYLKESRAPRMILTAGYEALQGSEWDDLAYTTAKGGIISMTYSQAKKLAQYGITVNAVAMGGIYNVSTISGESNESLLTSQLERLKARIPIGRLASPRDVAAAVCYLASEEAGFVTGEILKVNGGLAMG